MARKPKISNSRPARWGRAVAAAQKAQAALEAALDELEELRSEYEDWQQNLPESGGSEALREKLETIVGLDFEGAKDGFNVIDEADGADLPLGFGRD